jgi:hypothetical protein
MTGCSFALYVCLTLATEKPSARHVLQTTLCWFA